MNRSYPGDARETPASAAGDDDPWERTLLRPRAGGPAERLADRLAGRHTLLVYLIAVLGGFMLLAVTSIAIGAFVVDVVVPIGGVDSADESVVKDLVSTRDGTLTDISAIASTAAAGVVLPAIAAVAAIVFAAVRRWVLAAFLAVGLSIESASYRLTSLVNPRERPDVVRLDGYPADASFPSGHVAAAIVIYGGLALLIGSRISNRWARAGLVIAAVVIVTIVGASRMYRGMHHPIDLAAGVGIGCAALAVMVGASRAATAAAARRAERRVALREVTT